MKTAPHTITARIWLYSGKAAWYFITIKKEIRTKEDIHEQDEISITLKVLS